MKYYNLKQIKKLNCDFNIIIGERSNGKTTACLMNGLEEYYKSGREMAYLRRWRDDLRECSQLFDGVNNLNFIKQLTNNEWSFVIYNAKKWYLARYIDDDITKIEKQENPFCYAFSLSEMERYKSYSYPHIKNIVFDEFITRGMYVGGGDNEFKLFQNTLSTILRGDKSDARVYMLANTVNVYSPYFRNMGLTHLHEQKQGEITVYSVGDAVNAKAKIAVEYCQHNKEGKATDKFFVFDKNKMITDGGFEMGFHRLTPFIYKPKDVRYQFYCCFDGMVLSCDVVNAPKDYQGEGLGSCFINVYLESDEFEIPVEYKNLIFEPRPTMRKNSYNIYKCNLPSAMKIKKLITELKVCFESNYTGEHFMNFLDESKAVDSV